MKNDDIPSFPMKNVSLSEDPAPWRSIFCVQSMSHDRPIDQIQANRQATRLCMDREAWQSRILALPWKKRKTQKTHFGQLIIGNSITK